jgi:hypothetical protein
MTTKTEDFKRHLDALQWWSEAVAPEIAEECLRLAKKKFFKARIELRNRIIVTRE